MEQWRAVAKRQFLQLKRLRAANEALVAKAVLAEARETRTKGRAEDATRLAETLNERLDHAMSRIQKLALADEAKTLALRSIIVAIGFHRPAPFAEEIHRIAMKGLTTRTPNDENPDAPTHHES